jgi:hypothetical protein
MERTEYKGWPNCCRIANEKVELIVTADVGPRIIRFGFVGEENEFKEYEDMLGKTGGDEWRIYGGHRLWHSPEVKPRTYFPDNFPVEIEDHSEFVRLIQPIEDTTGIQKEIDIALSSDEAHVQVTHRLRNTNLWAVVFAPWALTVLAQGGKAIIPLPPRGTHEENLLPANTFTMWAYTDMTDPRWTWGKEYVMLEQDPKRESPQKLGVMVPDGWAAYVRNQHLFVKKFTYIQGAHYPDFGSSVETFTNGDMLELETLGPLACVHPEQTVEHVEDWFLFRDVPMPKDDDEVDEHILPRVEAVRGIEP